MKSTMQAMVVREFGGPEVMRMEALPTPQPGPGEVVIEVRAVSVNRTLDLVVRAGKYPMKVNPPLVLGVDPTGIIAAVGPGVTDRRVGDRVVTSLIVEPFGPNKPPVILGVHVWGGYAQYVKVPARITFPLPEGIDFPTATIVARHAPVAFSMLHDDAQLKSGEWVLVMGASGGLGSAGIQAAKYYGAKVIAAAGADDRVRAGLDLGADAGINYRTQDLAAEARAITGGRGVDVVFENIGDPDLFAKAFASLARGGRLVTAGSHGGGIVPLDVSRLYLNAITVKGSVGIINAENIALSLDATAAGKFRVIVDRVMPLLQAAEAHRLVADRSGLGKVVLVPPPV